MVMISFWAERDQNCLTIKSPLAFFVNLFKKKKYKVRNSNVKDNNKTSKVPTVLSVSVIDMRMSSPSPLSPALSVLTLTPGRTRDIDQDMEALRLSRRDNPFLQVLASKESLVESLFESESDDTNLMSQEFPNEIEVDPLSLPEIHEHMIRSPPPTTWPKSPNYKVFRFPVPDMEEISQGTNTQFGNLKKSPVMSSISIRDQEEETLENFKFIEVSERFSGSQSAIHSMNSIRSQEESPVKKCNNECRGSCYSFLPVTKTALARSNLDTQNNHSKESSKNSKFDAGSSNNYLVVSKKFT